MYIFIIHYDDFDGSANVNLPLRVYPWEFFRYPHSADRRLYRFVPVLWPPFFLCSYRLCLF